MMDDRYTEREQSQLRGDLDMEQLASFALRPDQHKALRAYRDRLRS